LRKYSVNLGRILSAFAVLGLAAGSSLLAAGPAIAAPAAVARPAAGATATTITIPMTLVPVTRLVRAAASPTGQAQVELADGAVVAIPAADVAGVLARAARDASDATPAAQGNCGTSDVAVKEKPDDHPVQMTTGFTVTVAAISYKWQVSITGPDKYSHTYNAGGGLMLRKSWSGSYASPADEPQGEYEAKVVVSNSYAVLVNMRICHSVGPTAKASLTSPDTPVSWKLSTAGAVATAPPAAAPPASVAAGSSPGFAGRAGQPLAAGQSPAASPLSPASVIGKDTRKRVTTTTVYPYRAIALLLLTFPKNKVASCTGFFYAANIVATAGHCLSNSSLGRVAKVQVIPGNNATDKPYGSCAGTTAYSVTGWVNSKNPLYDYGAVKLNCTIGNTVGWYGLYTTTGSLTGTVTITGYPTDKSPRDSLWTAAGKIASAAQRQVFYPISTNTGQSGAPVYRSGCGGYCAVAIHTYGVSPSHPTENAGTRITQVAFSNLLAWR
jgi:glutamyl endopeptidase